MRHTANSLAGARLGDNFRDHFRDYFRDLTHPSLLRIFRVDGLKG